MVKRKRSAEREVAERERSGERVEMAAQNPLKALNRLLSRVTFYYQVELISQFQNFST